MAGDWIKLHRKTLDSPVFSDGRLFHLWVYCLLCANWKDAKWPLPGTHKLVDIPRGSFITGRESLHRGLYPERDKNGKKIKRETDAPHARTVWRWMHDLVQWECITMQTLSSRCTLVSICNYSTYQNVDDKECPGDITARVPADVPADVQDVLPHVSTIEEGKESKEEITPADAECVPASLLELIDGWNSLGESIVAKGNGARRDPPAKEVAAGWKRVLRSSDLRDAFADIPSLLVAIRSATFCHTKGWFTLPWLFAKNSKSELNACRLLAGAYNTPQKPELVKEPTKYRA